MMFYVNDEIARAYGESCGQNGVSEEIYQYPPPALYEANYAARYGNSNNGIPFPDLTKLTNLLTCIQGFGYPYLGINTSSPCAILGQFIDLQAQMIASGTPVYRIPNLPPMLDVLNQNMWYANNILYWQIQPLAVSFETVLSYSGNFLGVGAQVALGQIDTTQSACYINTTTGGCVTSGEAFNKTGCAISVTVCNTSPAGVNGFYTLQASCASGTNIAPLSAVFNPTINGLQGGKCVLSTIPLVITGLNVPDNPSCTVTLSSNDADITPLTVILDVEVFVCNVFSGNSTNIPIPIPTNTSSIPVIAAQPTPPPDVAAEGDSNVAIVILVIAVVLVACIILIGIIDLCLYCCTKKG
jgi:hypothetical protein